jgi:uncharacterized protein (DUF1330 family)
MMGQADCQVQCSIDHRKESEMAKAYWVSAYRSIKDPEKMAAYAKLAGPALTGAGGRFIARGMPAAVREGGLQERMVIVEFDSVAAALAAYDCPAYKEALAALGTGSVEREIRIIEGT